MVDIETKTNKNPEQKYAEHVQSLQRGVGKTALEAARFVLHYERENAGKIASPLLCKKRSGIYDKAVREGNPEELRNLYERFRFQIENLPHKNGVFSASGNSWISETFFGTQATALEKVLFVINYEQDNFAPAPRPLNTPPIEPLFENWGSRRLPLYLAGLPR